VPATASALAGTTATASQPATRTRPPANLPAPIAQLTRPSAITTIDGPRDMPVPMLMYHVVGDVPQGAAFPDLYVKPSDFIAQMNYLSRHGYHAVTMQQVYDFWQGKGSLPDKPVVITFDDGFTTDYTLVAPLLKTVDWPATLFLIVGRHKPRMPHRQVQAMIDSGWELGSHTITHEELPSLSAKGMRKDIAGSRKLLRKEYHVPVNFFCYPSGKFNAQAEAEVQRAGYLLATTTVSGLARPSEPYTLRRVRVLGGMGVNSFAAALTNAR
jgi:peptidoglycan/xylan/chitin deacetylase (PgdA/CDA1 family)